MSLNWNMEKVTDVQTLHEDDNEWAITESIIWATMTVDLGEITEKNLDEWAYRLAMLQAVWGANMRCGGEPFYLTREHVERRVGLHANVGNMTRAQWLKKLLKDDNVNNIVKRQKASNEKVESATAALAN
jgi:hypothetical protein